MPQIELPEGIRFVKSAGSIQEYVLEKNGLTVLLMEDHSAPVAAVMVTYRAGSRNELPGATGAAHILEHMMFKGTDKYNRKKGTQIAVLLEQTGALLNANTGYDSTNYYELMPSDDLDLALDIEADRMRGTILDPGEFENEKNVVLNELERYFDSPVVELMTAVWKEAYRKHPYGHPVIGWRQDVQKMPDGELKKFYDTYYWPDNAVLTVVGDFKTADLLRRINQRYSEIPRSGSVIPAEVPEEPPQTEFRSVTVERNQGAEFVLTANKAPRGLHPDSAGLDLLSIILSHGKTSRLYRALVETGLAAQVESGGSGTRDAGLFTTLATLSPGVSHAEVLQEIEKAYAEIVAKGVSAKELERAKNQVLAEAAYSRDGALSVATELSNAIATGDWEYYVRYLDGVKAVSLDDLKRIAGRYLTRETMTAGLLKTAKKTAEGAGAALSSQPPAHERGAEPATAADSGAAAVPAKKPAPESRTGEHAEGARFYENSVKVFSAGNLRLAALRTEVKDMVAVTGLLSGGGSAYAENPETARLAMMMLDQGSLGRGKYEIAELLEDRGAQIQFGVEPEFLRFQVRCLKKDLPLVIGLLAEQIQHPAFDEKEFEKIRQQELVRFQYMLTSTSAQALNAFMRGVFPPDHALYMPDFAEQIAALKRVSAADAKKFHAGHYACGRLLIAAAGDLQADALWQEVQKSFGGWKGSPVKTQIRTAAPEDFEGRNLYVPVSDRGNMDVIMGHPLRLKKTDEDYIPVYLANYVLGADFTSRLSNVVRDQYGLTYGIRSGFIGVSEKIEGAWVVHMIVTPPQLDEGVKRTLEQLRLFSSEGISALELDQKKETVIGRFKIGLATSRDLADELLNVEQWEVGPSYLDRFPAMVQRTGMDQVRSAVSRYYNPDQLLIVAAGQLPPDSRFSSTRAALQKNKS